MISHYAFFRKGLWTYAAKEVLCTVSGSLSKNKPRQGDLVSPCKGLFYNNDQTDSTLSHLLHNFSQNK